MNVLLFATDGHYLKELNAPKLTSGSENVDSVRVRFDLILKESGCANYFVSISDPYNMKGSLRLPLEMDKTTNIGECVLPEAVTRIPGTFRLGVFGENEAEEKVFTTSLVNLEVEQGAVVDGENFSDSATVEAIEKILCDNNVEGEDTVSKVANVVGTLTEIEKLIDESGVIEYDNSF